MKARKTHIDFGKNADLSIDFLLGMMEDARVTTLNRVLDISSEELHWQFDKKWNSISVLLSHIYSVEMYFRIGFIEGRKLSLAEEKDINPGLEMGKYIPDLICDKPIDFYVKRLEKSRELMIESISNLSTEDFHKIREGYSEYGYNLAWALYHMSEDEIHHRGQTSIIRKLYKFKKTN